jgi:hypothetical protein
VGRRCSRTRPSLLFAFGGVASSGVLFWELARLNPRFDGGTSCSVRPVAGHDATLFLVGLARAGAVLFCPALSRAAEPGIPNHQLTSFKVRSGIHLLRRPLPFPRTRPWSGRVRAQSSSVEPLHSKTTPIHSGLSARESHQPIIRRKLQKVDPIRRLPFSLLVLLSSSSSSPLLLSSSYPRFYHQ